MRNGKFLFKKIGLRLTNRGTVLALAAFLVKQGLSSGVIPTQEVADSILVLADWATTALIALGILNNASIGKGLSDNIGDTITFTPSVKMDEGFTPQPYDGATGRLSDGELDHLNRHMLEQLEKERGMNAS
ncbi:hypothetical protein L4A40_26840 [Bacillus cereus]|uniref:hypothetical protein n=1 Tax=Bacillus cereus TaxID=1396 RepID=UPI001F0F1D4F|nr:hypothetical protein [Bacillus cereus]MCH5476704.1 hypothetical protein [Bacillus cereus]